MKRKLILTLALAALAVGVVFGAETDDSSLVRLYIGSVTDIPLGTEGPTRYEYTIHLLQRKECAGIIPTIKQEASDFVVEYEYEHGHYLLLWNSQGDLMAYRGGVMSSSNIVKDTCNYIRGVVQELKNNPKGISKEWWRKPKVGK